MDRDSTVGQLPASDGEGLRVAAATPLVQVAASSNASHYPLFADACARDGSHRDAGYTLADCLARASRCQRRGDGVACAVNGNGTCAARKPGSALHSILGDAPCKRANHSAVAVALVALDAEIEVDAVDTTRTFSAEGYFAVIDPNAPTPLPASWRVKSVLLPAAAAAGFQRLSSVDALDLQEASICLAASRRTDGDVRLVLGGVAPRPYRVYTSVEEEAMAGGLDDETITGLAERALLDAEADPASAAAVEVAAELLRKAIEDIAASAP